MAENLDVFRKGRILLMAGPPGAEGRQTPGNFAIRNYRVRFYLHQSVHQRHKFAPAPNQAGQFASSDGRRAASQFRGPDRQRTDTVPARRVASRKKMFAPTSPIPLNSLSSFRSRAGSGALRARRSSSGCAGRLRTSPPPLQRSARKCPAVILQKNLDRVTQSSAWDSMMMSRGAVRGPFLSLSSCALSSKIFGAPRLPFAGKCRMYRTMYHISSSVRIPFQAGMPLKRVPFSMIHFNCPSRCSCGDLRQGPPRLATFCRRTAPLYSDHPARGRTGSDA